MATPYDCPTCGQQHPRGCHGHVEECTVCQWRGKNYVGKPCNKCGGPVAQRPCKQNPRKGAVVCTAHGGNAPEALAKADERLILDRVAVDVAELLDGVATPGLDHTERLLRALERASNMAAAYEQLVRALAIHPVVVTEHETDARGRDVTTWRNENNALWGTDRLGDARPHVLVNELHRWTETEARLAKAAGDLNLGERRVQLEEGELDQLQQAVMRGLAAAELDAEQQARFTAAFVEVLRELETPPSG